MEEMTYEKLRNGASSQNERIKRIVELLREKPMRTIEIAEAVGVSQPTISKDMKILRDEGNLAFKRMGYRIYWGLTELL